ncbi:CRISPR-associated endonuclease Cas2 [Oribacterium sp. NK2B42]|uniref:CRISPR-associated endonuclease Cas2 n=1 Tax=Oribacterium sp. NK2B42 TaxID=689781 RepID=UPI0004929F8B|nr:CRISPR-associated endonuclease Cas2 [Oribacterium sp. NK2B42]
MIIISYDISNDKLRTKFSKYLGKYGHRIQFSVFEIDNSEKILNNIVAEIINEYEKRFSQEDSVIIFMMSSSCKTIRFGYAINEEHDLVMIT